MSYSRSISGLRKTSLVCHLTSPELTRRKQEVIAVLKKQVLESKETAHGFAYQFRDSDDILDQLSEFIKAERQCCPFFTFTLTLGQGSEGVWLELAGPEGAKEFIKTELEF